MRHEQQAADEDQPDDAHQLLDDERESHAQYQRSEQQSDALGLLCISLVVLTASWLLAQQLGYGWSTKEWSLPRVREVLGNSLLWALPVLILVPLWRAWDVRSATPWLASLAMLALLVLSEGKFNPDLLPWLLLLNPADVYRLINLSGFDGGATTAGVFAHIDTPKPIIARLNEGVVAGLKDETANRRLRDLGAIVRPSTPEQFTAALTADEANVSELLRLGLLKPE